MYIHIHIHIYIYVNIHIYLHIYIFVVNVILARQTCGQRSSKAAESRITAAQWRLPGGKRVPTQGKLDFATALRMKRRLKKSTIEKTPWFGSFLL